MKGSFEFEKILLQGLMLIDTRGKESVFIDTSVSSAPSAFKQKDNYSLENSEKAFFNRKC